MSQDNNTQIKHTTHNICFNEFAYLIWKGDLAFLCNLDHISCDVAIMTWSDSLHNWLMAKIVILSTIKFWCEAEAQSFFPVCPHQTNTHISQLWQQLITSIIYICC